MKLTFQRNYGYVQIEVAGGPGGPERSAENPAMWDDVSTKLTGLVGRLNSMKKEKGSTTHKTAMCPQLEKKSWAAIVATTHNKEAPTTSRVTTEEADHTHLELPTPMKLGRDSFVSSCNEISSQRSSVAPAHDHLIPNWLVSNSLSMKHQKLYPIQRHLVPYHTKICLRQVKHMKQLIAKMTNCEFDRLNNVIGRRSTTSVTDEATEVTPYRTMCHVGNGGGRTFAYLFPIFCDIWWRKRKLCSEGQGADVSLKTALHAVYIPHRSVSTTSTTATFMTSLHNPSGQLHNPTRLSSAGPPHLEDLIERISEISTARCDNTDPSLIPSQVSEKSDTTGQQSGVRASGALGEQHSKQGEHLSSMVDKLLEDEEEEEDMLGDFLLESEDDILLGNSSTRGPAALGSSRRDSVGDETDYHGQHYQLRSDPLEERCIAAVVLASEFQLGKIDREAAKLLQKMKPLKSPRASVTESHHASRESVNSHDVHGELEFYMREIDCDDMEYKSNCCSSNTQYLKTQVVTSRSVEPVDCDVLVTTPAKLLQLRSVDLSNVRHLILDDAEHMCLDLESGGPTLSDVVGFLRGFLNTKQREDVMSLSKKRFGDVNVALFTTVYSSDVEILAKALLTAGEHGDKHLSITKISGITGCENSLNWNNWVNSAEDFLKCSAPKLCQPVHRIPQKVLVFYGRDSRIQKLKAIAMELKSGEGGYIDGRTGRVRQVMVFTALKKTAETLGTYLRDMCSIPCAVLHGDMHVKDRLRSMQLFSCGECPVLVTTDTAITNMDRHDKFDDSLIYKIISFDLPTSIQDYTQRVLRIAPFCNGGHHCAGVVNYYVHSKLLASDGSMDNARVQPDSNFRMAKDLVTQLNIARCPVPAWLGEEAKGFGKKFSGAGLGPAGKENSGSPSGASDSASSLKGIDPRKKSRKKMPKDCPLSMPLHEFCDGGSSYAGTAAARSSAGSVCNLWKGKGGMYEGDSYYRVSSNNNSYCTMRQSSRASHYSAKSVNSKGGARNYIAHPNITGVNASNFAGKTKGTGKGSKTTQNAIAAQEQRNMEIYLKQIQDVTAQGLMEMSASNKISAQELDNPDSATVRAIVKQVHALTTAQLEAQREEQRMAEAGPRPKILTTAALHELNAMNKGSMLSASEKLAVAAHQVRRASYGACPTSYQGSTTHKPHSIDQVLQGLFLHLQKKYPDAGSEKILELMLDDVSKSRVLNYALEADEDEADEFLERRRSSTMKPPPGLEDSPVPKTNRIYDLLRNLQSTSAPNKEEVFAKLMQINDDDIVNGRNYVQGYLKSNANVRETPFPGVPALRAQSSPGGPQSSPSGTSQQSSCGYLRNEQGQLVVPSKKENGQPLQALIKKQQNQIDQMQALLQGGGKSSNMYQQYEWNEWGPHSRYQGSWNEDAWHKQNKRAPVAPSPPNHFEKSEADIGIVKSKETFAEYMENKYGGGVLKK